MGVFAETANPDYCLSFADQWWAAIFENLSVKAMR